MTSPTPPLTAASDDAMAQECVEAFKPFKDTADKIRAQQAQTKPYSVSVHPAFGTTIDGCGHSVCCGTPEGGDRESQIESSYRWCDILNRTHQHARADLFRELHITSDEQHKRLLGRIDALMDAEADTPEGVELSVLAAVVDSYEQQKYPIRTSGRLREAVKSLLNIIHDDLTHERQRQLANELDAARAALAEGGAA